MSPGVPGPFPVPSVGGKRWYVVKVQAGREQAVKEAVERRARVEGLEESLGRIVIPTEKVAELRRGKRTERSRKLFPGYLVCEVALDERVLALFRETRGVSDFVGAASVPVPLSPREVEAFVGGQGESQVRVVVPAFEPGERVRVTDGVIAQMEGEVEEVLGETGQVRVRLTILGQPVALDVEALGLRRISEDR
jgi:transcription termination/antitermination protein NusG